MPTVVASAEGSEAISDYLSREGRAIDLIMQERPLGMGDAVLSFNKSSSYMAAEHILLLWGDLPFIMPGTIESLVKAHTSGCYDFTFVTKQTKCAYTRVERDAQNRVIAVRETREEGLSLYQGERDVGLFVFRKRLVMDLLREELPGKRGGSTGEHGFLYIIRHLVARGFRVEGLPIAEEIELRSLNHLSDLEMDAS